MNHLERALDRRNKWWKPILFTGLLIFSLIPFRAFLSGVFKMCDCLGLEFCSFVDGSFSQILDNQISMFLFIFISYFMLIVVAAFIIKFLYKRNFKEVINGTQKIRWSRFFYAFGVWFGLMLIYFIISYLFNPQGFVFNFDFNNFLILFFLTLIAIPFQASFEEFVFRGYLAQLIGSYTRSRWSVIILPSIIFGLMHLTNPEVEKYGVWLMMPQYIFMGIVFGIISVLDDGIESAMGAHTGNNIFLCIFLTFDESVLPTDALFRAKSINPIGDFIVIILMSFLFIKLLSSFYGWNFKILNSRIIRKPNSNLD